MEHENPLNNLAFHQFIAQKNEIYNLLITSQKCKVNV